MPWTVFVFPGLLESSLWSRASFYSFPLVLCQRGAAIVFWLLLSPARRQKLISRTGGLERWLSGFCRRPGFYSRPFRGGSWVLGIWCPLLTSWAPGVHVEHRHTYRQNTLKSKRCLRNSIIFFPRVSFSWSRTNFFSHCSLAISILLAVCAFHWSSHPFICLDLWIFFHRIWGEGQPLFPQYIPLSPIIMPCGLFQVILASGSFIFQPFCLSGSYLLILGNP